MPYQPALDGVRAVAVLLVLGFHLEWPWMSGGYLGVSVFFTLSGYLITSLILTEQRQRTRIDLGGFYERRLRRLAPAALATILAVAIAAAFGLYEQSRALRSGLIGAVLQVENWVELIAGRSYADLFADPNPVAHFWSLSIEEQFYWVWPVAMIGIGAFVVRRDGRHLVTVLAALWVLSAISAPLTAWWWSPSAAYFATWARLPEILAGAVLAAIMMRIRVRPGADALALVALLAIIVASGLTPDGSGWPYQGGLPLFSIVSAALIAGLQAPGVVRSALGVSALVWIGRRSYGIYLVHWPIFVLFDAERTGLDGIRLDAFRLALTFGLAALSFRFLEQPIRSGHRIIGRRRFVVGFAATSILVIPVVLVLVSSPTTAPPAPLIISADSAVDTVVEPDADSLGSDDETAPPTTAPDRSPIDMTNPFAGLDASGNPLSAALPTVPSAPTVDVASLSTPTRVVVFGDSVPAWLLRDAASTYSNRDAVVVNGAVEGCDGALETPVGRDRHGAELRAGDECQTWDVWYDDVLDRGGGDIALLVLGQAAVVDRYVDDRWTHPCESTDWYIEDVGERIDLLRSRGLDVVVALPARPGSKWAFILPDDQVDRTICVRDDLAALADDRDVITVDLDPILCPEEDCDALRRRDGLHVDPEHAAGVLEQLMTRTLMASGIRR